MKWILLALILVMPTAYAKKCTYYMQYDWVLYEGYTINYSSAVTSLMEAKGFERVFDNSADYQLEFDLKTEVQSRFEHAIVTAYLYKNQQLSFTLTEGKRCFTTSCAVSDVAKSFNNLIVAMKKNLKNCQN
jgi:hypothetical protein